MWKVSSPNSRILAPEDEDPVAGEAGGKANSKKGSSKVGRNTVVEKDEITIQMSPNKKTIRDSEALRESHRITSSAKKKPLSE